MSQKEIIGYIFPKIEEGLREFGFHYKKSKNVFVRKKENGWFRISVGVYQFAQTNNINIGFALRDDRIENEFVQLIDINPSNWKDSSTLLLHLSTIVGYPDAAFEFKTLNEFDKLFESIISVFLKKTVPYLMVWYSNLENVYELYTNRNSREYNLVRKTYYNCIKALVLGRFLFPFDFDKVIKTCELQMKEIKQNTPESLDAQSFDENYYRVVNILKTKNIIPIL